MAGFLSFLEKIIILYRRYKGCLGREGLDKTKIEMPPYIRVRSLKSPIASPFFWCHVNPLTHGLFLQP